MTTFSDLFTHTRASSATYTDANGILQTAAINEPRTNAHYWNGSAWVKGYQHESESRTNLVLNSDTLATQSRTVTAVPHTLHFTGTGTVTLSGASTAGPLVGTGTSEQNRVNLTFTPTAGTLTLTVTGSVTFAQLEAGSTPSSYTPTAGATVTRAADVMTLPIANIPYPDVVETTGIELVTNGDFASGEAGWSFTGSDNLVVSAGVATFTSDGTSSNSAYQEFSTETGKTYRLSVGSLTISGGLLRCGTFKTGAEFLNSSASGPKDLNFVATSATTFVSFGYGSIGATVTIDNISVREINPLAVSIAMDGVMTYADTVTSGLAVNPYSWRIDNNTQIRGRLSVVSGSDTGQWLFQQTASGINDEVGSGVGSTSGGVNVPFSIASRHGSTFINGAVDGVALTADLTPVAFPNLSATNMSIAPTFNGFIHKFRMWGDTTGDIGNAGIAEASA